MSNRTFVFLVLVVLVVAGICAALVGRESRKQCRGLGGHVVSVDRSWLCVKDGLIIELEGKAT